MTSSRNEPTTRPVDTSPIDSDRDRCAAWPPPGRELPSGWSPLVAALDQSSDLEPQPAPDVEPARAAESGPRTLLEEQLRELSLSEDAPPDAEAWRIFLSRMRRSFEAAESGGPRIPLPIGIDQTEARRLEEDARQAQKMESIGRLAGGIAHDFNNVLSAILAYGHFCLDATRRDDPVRADIQEIINAARRAAELTHNLLAFSRKQVLQPQVVVLNTLVADVHKMLRHLIGEQIELVTDLEPSPWTVSADPGQITQVLMNLALNARDAMPNGGRLSIETHNVRIGAAEAARLAVPPGKYVTVAVADTGVGMDRQTMSHLFEPFFTTKERGKGTGLGLATSFGIVKQSHGTLSVDSEPGRGARFTVYLPRADASFGTGESKIRSMAPMRGAGSALVIEDDPAVREVVRRLLAARGFEVVTVGHALEALETIERLGRTFRFVLSDVVVPGGNGFAIARQVGKRWPDLPFIFMSGYAETSNEIDSDTFFLPKPFTPRELDEILRTVAGASSTWRVAPSRGSI